MNHNNDDNTALSLCSPVGSVSHNITSVITNNPLSAVIQFAVITAAAANKKVTEGENGSGGVEGQAAVSATRFHFDSAGFIPGG